MASSKRPKPPPLPPRPAIRPPPRREDVGSLRVRDSVFTPEPKTGPRNQTVLTYTPLVNAFDAIKDERPKCFALIDLARMFPELSMRDIELLIELGEAMLMRRIPT
jgi:hypothetical protein